MRRRLGIDLVEDRFHRSRSIGHRLAVRDRHPVFSENHSQSVF